MYKIPIDSSLISYLNEKKFTDNVKFFNMIFILLDSEFTNNDVFPFDKIDRIYLFNLDVVREKSPSFEYNYTNLYSILEDISEDGGLFTEFQYHELWDEIEVERGSTLFYDDRLIISKELMENSIYSYLYTQLNVRSSGILGAINLDYKTVKSYVNIETSIDILNRINRLYIKGKDISSLNISEEDTKSTLESTLKVDVIDGYITGYDRWLDFQLPKQISKIELVINKTESYTDYIKIENIRSSQLFYNINNQNETNNNKVPNYHEYSIIFKEDYSISLIGDVVMRRRYFGNKEEKVLSYKYNTQLGEIPLLVGSKYSPIGEYLNSIPKSRWRDALQIIDSNLYIRGGYYIIGGTPRIYINQRTLMNNKPHIYLDKDGNLLSTITSHTDFGYALSNFYIDNNCITFVFRKMNRVKENLLTLVRLFSNRLEYIFRDELNQTSIFNRVMSFLFNNIRSYVIDIIMSKDYNNFDIMKYIEKLEFYLSMTKYQYDQYSHKNYIKPSSVENMYEDWIPQIAMNRFDSDLYDSNSVIDETLSKFYFTSILVGNLILCQMGIIPLTDKNSTTNIKLQTPVDLTELHARRVFNYIYDLVNKDLTRSRETSSKVMNLKTIMNVFTNQIHKEISIKMKEPLKTMKWGAIVTNNTKDNYVQDPDPDTDFAFNTSISRVSTPTNKRTRDVNVRSGHPHDFGFFDYVRTPESTSCGLVTYITEGARISATRDDNIIYRILLDNDLLIFDYDPECFEILTPDSILFINSKEFISLSTDYIFNNREFNRLGPRTYEIKYISENILNKIESGVIKSKSVSDDSESKSRSSKSRNRNRNNESNTYKLSVVLNGKFIGFTTVDAYPYLEDLKYRAGKDDVTYYISNENLHAATSNIEILDRIFEIINSYNYDYDDEINGKTFILGESEYNITETQFQDLLDLFKDIENINMFDYSYYTWNSTIYIDTDGTRLIKPIISMKSKEMYERGELDNMDINELINQRYIKYVSPNELWNNLIYNSETGEWSQNIETIIYEDIEKEDKIYNQVIENRNNLSTIYNSINGNSDLFFNYQGDIYNSNNLDELREYLSEIELYISTLSEYRERIKYFTLASLNLGKTANGIPLRKHTAGNRNMYQASMDNQKTEVKGTSNSLSNTSTMKKMFYGNYSHFSNPSEQVIANTDNVLIYVGSMGHNQEDLIMMNKNISDLGQYMGMSYKSLVVNFVNDSNPNYVKRLTPWPTDIVSPPFPIDHLDSNGVVKQGTYLVPGMPIYTYVKKYTQFSVPDEYIGKLANQNNYGYVYKIINTKSEEQKTNIILKIVRYTKVLDGDKFKDSNGAQKGTTLLIPYNQFPYSMNGTIPGVIFAPSGYPSRMSVGHPIAGYITSAVTQTSNYRYRDDKPISYNIDKSYRALFKNGFSVNGKDIFYLHGRKIKNEITFFVMEKDKLRHLSSEKVKNPHVNDKRNQATGQSQNAPRLGYMAQRLMRTYGLYEFSRSIVIGSDSIIIPYCTRCSVDVTYAEDIKSFHCNVCNSSEFVYRIDTRKSFVKFINMLASMGLSTNIDIDSGLIEE